MPMGDNRDKACKESEPHREEGDTADALLATRRYSCLCFPCFGTHRPPANELSWWERVKATQFNGEDRWWSGGIRSVKKLREWSEIVAGPRWKTFIRRFNRNRTPGVRLGRFQYDPISYALNFDEGTTIGHNGNIEFEDGNGDYNSSGMIQNQNQNQNFSTRFPSIQVPVKPAATGAD